MNVVKSNTPVVFDTWDRALNFMRNLADDSLVLRAIEDGELHVSDDEIPPPAILTVKEGDTVLFEGPVTNRGILGKAIEFTKNLIARTKLVPGLTITFSDVIMRVKAVPSHNYTVNYTTK